MFLVPFRLVTSLGVVVLAARQRMWSCVLVGLALFVIETWAIFVAVRRDGPWAERVALAYGMMAVLAVVGWAAGRRFRARHGDTELRREASELPLLHPFLVLVEALFVLPIAFLS